MATILAKYGSIWSRIVCRVLLLPIKVEGRENIDKHQSYVFVANHQGPMDIFLIYGYLNRNFKWMMKKALRKMPLASTTLNILLYLQVASKPRL